MCGYGGLNWVGGIPNSRKKKVSGWSWGPPSETHTKGKKFTRVGVGAEEKKPAPAGLDSTTCYPSTTWKDLSPRWLAAIQFAWPRSHHHHLKKAKKSKMASWVLMGCVFYFKAYTCFSSFIFLIWKIYTATTWNLRFWTLLSTSTAKIIILSHLKSPEGSFLLAIHSQGSMVLVSFFFVFPYHFCRRRIKR